MSQEPINRRQPFIIDWREGFKVKIEQADKEHEHLFKLVRDLNTDSVAKTVNELFDYIVVHFSNEQTLMEKSAYPAFEQHLKLHEDFTTQLADFLGNSHTWSEERTQDLRRFLNKWLVGHIVTHDLRFGKWYEEHTRQFGSPVTFAAREPAGRTAEAQVAVQFSKMLENRCRDCFASPMCSLCYVSIWDGKELTGPRLDKYCSDFRQRMRRLLSVYVQLQDAFSDFDRIFEQTFLVEGKEIFDGQAL